MVFALRSEIGEHLDDTNCDAVHLISGRSPMLTGNTPAFFAASSALRIRATAASKVAPGRSNFATAHASASRSDQPAKVSRATRETQLWNGSSVCPGGDEARKSLAHFPSLIAPDSCTAT